MEISIWSPDWGLPSVDFGCLSMIAYAKFSGAPVTIKDTNSPFWSPNGKLPVFRHKCLSSQCLGVAEDLSGTYENSNEITNFQEFVTHLRKNKFSADYNLTPKQCSEVRCYIRKMPNRH